MLLMYLQSLKQIQYLVLRGPQSQPLSFEIDTVIPVIESVVVSEDNSSVTVTAEPNAIVTLTDDEGNVLVTGSTDENGIFTYTPDTPFNSGAVINVEVADNAGNAVIEQVRAGIEEVIAAADNDVQLVLDITPTVTVNQMPTDLNSTGFHCGFIRFRTSLNASVLESVFGSSVQLSVDSGTTRDVDFYADAGGIAAGTMNLYMYKLNASTNE